MTAAVDRFVNYLVMKCEDEDNTDFLDDLLTKADAQITSGNGSIGFLQSVSANGKTVNQADKLTCDELAFACRRAKRLYTDAAGNSPFTFLDFSGISRTTPRPC